MIHIYTLPQCNYCKQTKELLEGERIPFKEYSTETYPETCARLEVTLHTNYYPIVKIQGGSAPTFIISNNTEEPRTTYPRVHYFSSSPHLVELIKKLIS